MKKRWKLVAAIGLPVALAAGLAFRADLKLDGGWKLMRFDLASAPN